MAGARTIFNKVQQKMSLFASFIQLGAGLSVGLSGLAGYFFNKLDLLLVLLVIVLL